MSTSIAASANGMLTTPASDARLPRYPPHRARETQQAERVQRHGAPAHEADDADGVLAVRLHLPPELRHPAAARRKEREEVAAAIVPVAELQHGPARAGIGTLHQLMWRQRDGDVAAQSARPVEEMPHHGGRQQRVIAGGEQHRHVLGQRGQCGGRAGRGRDCRAHPADRARHRPRELRRSPQRFRRRAAEQDRVHASALLQRAHDANDHRHAGDGRQALGRHPGRDRDRVVLAPIRGQHDGVESGLSAHRVHARRRGSACRPARRSTR